MNGIIVALVGVIIVLGLVCFKLDCINEELRQEIAKMFYEKMVKEVNNSRKDVRFINPNLGDQSVLDMKVKRLLEEGYSFYKEGCQCGLIAFAKDVKIEEE